MMEQESLSPITVGIGEVIGKFEVPEKYRVPTGFEDLDQLIGQLQKGQFIVVGSRTEQGGLSFILNIGLNAAKAQKSVAFFSFTMNEERVVEQFMSIVAGIDTHSMQTRRLVDTDSDQLVCAMGTLQEMSLWISDAALTVEDIERQVEEAIAKNGALDLVIIDSIELLESEKKEYPDQRAYSMSRMLKLLSRKFNISVVALCHIPSTSQRKVPQLLDVKNSEPFADIVLLLYFDQVYNPESERRSILDVLIVKNSNGPMGEVSLYYSTSHSSIQDIKSIKPEGLSK